MRAKIRVLVADDSATMRVALVTLLGAEPDLEIIGQAADGVDAVNKARSLRPDVITMDVNMPRLDGLGATAAIMAEAPSRVLVVCSVSEDRQLDLSFRAMAAGALELIEKPGSGEAALRRWGKRVAESVRLMAEVPVVRRDQPHAAHPQVGKHRPIEAMGIVASTGGPPALAKILSDLPPSMRLTLLVAQHIAEGFTAGLVRWFSGITRLTVAIAQSGQRAKPAHVYLPPDGHDLELDRFGMLRTPRSAGLHCPSGNRLLQSLAKGYGPRAAGLVLTGMGDDGAQGLLALHNAGGITFAQDEATSVVFGMPHAALACGATKSQIALESVAAVIQELCKNDEP